MESLLSYSVNSLLFGSRAVSLIRALTFSLSRAIIPFVFADVAELADASDLKSDGT